MYLDVALVGGPVEELAAARGALETVGAVAAVVGGHVASQRPLLTARPDVAKARKCHRRRAHIDRIARVI